MQRRSTDRQRTSYPNSVVVENDTEGPDVLKVFLYWARCEFFVGRDSFACLIASRAYSVQCTVQVMRMTRYPSHVDIRPYTIIKVHFSERIEQGRATVYTSARRRRNILYS